MGSIGPYDPYVLARDTKASARLCGQSMLFHLRTGWLLHPKITESIKDKKNIEIADLAAGQCYFALRLAEERPDAKITALDISDAQYPPKWMRPANVDFKTWDIFSEVPEEYIGRFDVVHLRLIVGATQGRDQEVVNKNLIKLLKPGGVLQYQEAVGHLWHHVDHSFRLIPDESPAFNKLLDRLAPIYSNSMTYNDLDDRLRKQGLLDVERYHMPVRPHLLDYETHSIIWTMTELADVIKSGEADESYVKELEVAKADLYVQVANGLRLAYDAPLFIGRKA